MKLKNIGAIFRLLLATTALLGQAVAYAEGDAPGYVKEFANENAKPNVKENAKEKGELKRNAQASNTLELRSTFKGNQEQPKVMYIVPWQAIEAPPASYRPVSSLIAENFQLVDREEFQRNVHFSDRIKKANRSEAERFNALVNESR